MDQSFLLLVLLLNLFFLCQLGSAFQSRSSSHVVPGTFSTNGAGLPYGARFPGPGNRQRGSIYDRNMSDGFYPYWSDCDIDGGLPCPEMVALKALISKLGLNPAPSITRGFCGEDRSLGSITIGCTCNGSVCHITEINMDNAGLTGVIVGEVAELAYLKTLDLSNNEIHGYIPNDIGNLTNLTTLDLNGNQLSGTIPESLGNLNKLKNLFLYMNLLSGWIPQSLGNLSSLQYLNLRGNKLSGEIPSELGNLSQLELLRLDDNELSGELPSELGNLSNLEDFWVTSNKLKGELPKEYENLKNLTYFEVGGNYLSGSIPPFIANWTNLTSLNLMGNDFDGGLPPEIFNMTSLEYLWVSDLKKPGLKFPESANLSNVNQVILRDCSITGKIPEYIGNWSWLRVLDLSFNSLNGGIPDSFQNLSLLKMFLTGNKLSGTIPGWIDDVVYYKGDLSYNDFTFPEPGKEHMTKIYQIMDERCHDKKSKFHSLFINAGGEEITIDDKRHYDADRNTSLFYISPNHWAYSCSGDFQSSSSNSSDYIKNMTCGVASVDAPLYEKARLCPQALTYYGFCLQNGNYTVTLHFAETVYAKDEDHSSSGKRVFDIYIQGIRVWKDYNIKDRAGGPNKICNESFPATVYDNMLEIRLFWAGKGSAYNPPSLNGPLISAISVKPDFKVGGLPFAIIIVIIVAAIFIPLLLLAFMWTMGWVGHKEWRETQVELRGKSYTVKQVVDATQNFSSEMEIGRGQFGRVYKAVLPDQTVAVKKLSPQSKQVIDQIGREVYTLKTVKHHNLVEFLDGYFKRGLHLLIYEYMENRSLAFALFDSKSNLLLDWNTRFNICLAIAEALKYLHEDSRLKIVHRNIKPSNILLDKELNAKVSDFGLAKIYEDENLNLAIGAGDTLVYMAPEYATVKVVTEKADVYSYGIVLLEIVSGKRDADFKSDQETVYLIDKACLLHSKGKLVNLIDEKLLTYNRDQALTILDIAILCIDRSPSRRPTMSGVVSVLKGNKNIKEISKVDTPSA
ncbi:hypothetical protein QYF36_003706 [Acer negundo]|nr:hypothetical protein QYF36_003706 [Acer negundo]